jgi:hypothetical protein
MKTLKEPQYTANHNNEIITLTIDFNESNANSAYAFHGLMRSLENGDLHKLIQHNTWYDESLL